MNQYLLSTYAVEGEDRARPTVAWRDAGIHGAGDALEAEMDEQGVRSSSAARSTTRTPRPSSAWAMATLS